MIRLKCVIQAECVLCRQLVETSQSESAAAKNRATQMEEEAAQEGVAETLDGIYDEQDAAQIPCGEPSAAELREQQLLDEMPLPGFPKDEADRRKQWSKIPRVARAAIRRLHTLFGHSSKGVLREIWKDAKADASYVNACMYFKCEDSARTEQPPNRPTGFLHRSRASLTVPFELL